MILANGSKVYADKQAIGCVISVGQIGEKMTMRDRTSLVDTTKKTEPSFIESGALSLQIKFDEFDFLQSMRNGVNFDWIIAVGKGEEPAYHPTTDEILTNNRPFIRFNGRVTSWQLSDLSADKAMTYQIDIEINTELKTRLVRAQTGYRLTETGNRRIIESGEPRIVEVEI